MAAAWLEVEGSRAHGPCLELVCIASTLLLGMSICLRGTSRRYSLWVAEPPVSPSVTVHGLPLPAWSLYALPLCPVPSSGSVVPCFFPPPFTECLFGLQDFFSPGKPLLILKDPAGVPSAPLNVSEWHVTLGSLLSHLFGASCVKPDFVRIPAS